MSNRGTPNYQLDATIAPEQLSKCASPTSSRFGDYELLTEIARGGMGVVYKARHTKLNRIVAIKMILGGRFSSEEELKRFQVEAEAVARLDHPGIVPVFDIGEQDGQAYFAMKFIEGTSLAEQMNDFRDSPKKSVTMMVQIAHAIHHARQRRNPKWLLLMRYGISWLAISVALVLAMNYLLDEKINNNPTRNYPVTISMVVLGSVLVVFATMRRWRTPTIESESP